MIGPQKILVPFFVFASINFELDTVKVKGGAERAPPVGFRVKGQISCSKSFVILVDTLMRK